MAHHKKLNTDQENTLAEAYENSKNFLISSTNSRSDFQNRNNKDEKSYNDDIIYQYNLDDWQG